MKGIGIYGGTFDPVHNGHLITARAVYEIRDLEKIIFIPANVSPHKIKFPASSPEDRFNMLKKATEDIPFFEVSDIEILSGGVSYTVDTLRKLSKKYDNIELIIGYDNLLNFHTWKEPYVITELAKLVVLRRENDTRTGEYEFFDKAIFVQTPVIEISATDIRSRAARGMPVNFLVPEKVMEYIYTFNLYKQ